MSSAPKTSSAVVGVGPLTAAGRSISRLARGRVAEGRWARCRDRNRTHPRDILVTPPDAAADRKRETSVMTATLGPCISADSHVTEPPGTYLDRIDPAYRDRAPRLHH